MNTPNAPAIKRFRLKHGFEIWNTASSGSETDLLYRENFERRCYEKHGVAVKDGDVVCDIGANIGMFALSLMERFRDLQIYCVEPVPATFDCLSRNLEESPFRENHKVTVLNLALGTDNALTTIEYFPEAPGNSSLYPESKHRDFVEILDGVRLSDLWRINKKRALLLAPLFPLRKRLLRPIFRRIMDNGVQVSCTMQTLSGLIREHGLGCIDLLKIDVEGAEMDVLSGIEESHWPLIRQLSMEIDPVNKPRLPDLTDHLRSLGFSEVTVESMFGDACKPDNPVPCTLFAVRPAIAVK